jgi:outer membrane protein OmpA-like peptidoglycan-associated protein
VETGPDSMRELEGKVTTIRYTLREGAKAPTVLQVERNYRNALQKAGARILYEDDDRITATFERGGAEVWAAIRAYGGHYVVRIVEIGEMPQEVTASNILAELDSTGRVSLYILFDTGQATIRAESTAILDEVSAALRERATLRVAIEGHTDAVGAADANEALSQRRARAVLDALVARGIEASRLSSAGFGETRPVADNQTEEGRAKNRRVELVKH